MTLREIAFQGHPNGVYGGEMPAHHYFRDFMASDSGMIPSLLILEPLRRRGQLLADLVGEQIAAFHTSGEVNFRVDGVARAIL